MTDQHQDLIQRLTEECERLRKEMHEAPLAKIYTRHDGSRFIDHDQHTYAWANRSREWCQCMDKLDAAKRAADVA
ncbi:hypothetical protein [Sinorhizobium meliloti]|uniref:hypothetical protein n=1 Tax=Rhizobium meliloti TaxID=382 RepID=UPI00299D2264|nr:hypothetical protein [Sinorhizobium meliloti]MDW9991065.1 hypothetical protein [Sinorhizobium meliloti]MDX0245465.1 hypothetical protein [Sinorhizobium meliloti]MDX0401531.1 hypothetical protein [Sinorhizobium meliloti]